jgi:hypothetical protein
MAKSPSPFAGMKLTEQTPLAQSGLDQKLFSRPTPLPEKPVPQEPQEKQEKEEVAKPRPTSAVKSQKRAPVRSATAEGKRFDLNLPTEKSHTFAFTFEELWALEEVKTGLSRLLGLDQRITKIDIIRCALHMIVDDYRQRGEQSFIVDRFKNKKPVEHTKAKKPR